jgi:hypothetical protein
MMIAMRRSSRRGSRPSTFGGHPASSSLQAPHGQGFSCPMCRAQARANSLAAGSTEFEQRCARDAMLDA